MLYTSIVVTLCVVCFLHLFERVQCQSTRHLNEYNNRSSLTRRCLQSCFLVRIISVLIRQFLNICLSDSGICTKTCKVKRWNKRENTPRSKVNTNSCCDLFDATKCDQKTSCLHMYLKVRCLKQYSKNYHAMSRFLVNNNYCSNFERNPSYAL